MVPMLSNMFLERMVEAVEMVRDRLERAVAALEAGGVPYAVIGGNAVAAWVASIDKRAVRTTQDVDILLRRDDLDAATEAMEKAGFIYQNLAGVDLFLDGPDSTLRNAVHVIMAGERVQTHYAAPAPDITEFVRQRDTRVLALEALVRMKLTSYRRKDQLHVSDMLSVGLIDATWKTRFPPELADRLQHLIETPEG